MVINEIMLLTNWLLDYLKKVFDFNIGKNLLMEEVLVDGLILVLKIS